MKIIEPSVELMRDFDGDEILKFIERCGRTCYLSEKNIPPDSAKFVKNLIKRGHESVLEHFSVTFKIICDRGVMAELTRHRLASFSIESTRYNNYASEKFDGELTFIKPCFWKETDTLRAALAAMNGISNIPLQNSPFYDAWKTQLDMTELLYIKMLEEGATPEQARAILPNSLKTEIVMTANLREWRHILKLRTDKKAHPQMREIAFMILNVLKEKLPVVFADIGE